MNNFIRVDDDLINLKYVERIKKETDHLMNGMIRYLIVIYYGNNKSRIIQYDDKDYRNKTFDNLSERLGFDIDEWV